MEPETQPLFVLRILILILPRVKTLFPKSFVWHDLGHHKSFVSKPWSNKQSTGSETQTSDTENGTSVAWES